MRCRRLPTGAEALVAEQVQAVDVGAAGWHVLAEVLMQAVSSSQVTMEPLTDTPHTKDPLQAITVIPTRYTFRCQCWELPQAHCLGKQTCSTASTVSWNFWRSSRPSSLSLAPDSSSCSS